MRPLPFPRPILVDRRNLAGVLPRLLASVVACDLVGLDCETHDAGRHDGLRKYCREKADGRTSRTVFDMRRTVMTGFSLWPEGHDEVYYINLEHADEANRVGFDEVRDVLDAAKGFVAHNAPFEINTFRLCHGYEIDDRVICSLQLCVSAYGPDEYDPEDFIAVGTDPFRPIMDQLYTAGTGYDGVEMTPAQGEVFAKITGKQSKARYSYNGLVKSIAYGYGLKQAVRSHFGHVMTSYEDVLGDKVHMGQVTGEDVVAYGCDDAYWAVRLFRHLADIVTPGAWKAYVETELPMVPVYAEVWRSGLRVDLGAVRRRILDERVAMAAALRGLRAEVRKLLPFEPDDNPALAEREAWYAENYAKYRELITVWAELGDGEDTAELLRTRGATSTAVAQEAGVSAATGPNFSHYMPQRTLLYDLLGAEPVISDKKVSSDGEARGKVKERFQADLFALGSALPGPVGDEHLDKMTRAKAGIAVVDRLNEMAGIEQHIKLFLTPYEQLIDPETGRVYPVLSSMLATRRMATSYPNPMQLSKRGVSTYVRGFFRGDADDHVVLSLDWSGIELVLIGELSGDPGFLEAYGQLPHADLHSKAAASILRMETGRPITTEMFKALARMTEEEAIDVFGEKVLVNSKGQRMTPEEAYKFHRGTDGGKGANFGYPYSGALSSLGESRGWTKEQMWAATEAYREEFPVMEKWRTDTIEKVVLDGYVELPDGHRRARYEATYDWAKHWLERWSPTPEPFRRFVGEIGRRIQTRAKNQAVNAMIQGSCATLAKRSILRFKSLGWSDRECRFMVPIHDELVFSVRHDLVVDAIREIKNLMCDHPDLFERCKLDASPSVGLNFEPFKKDKAPYGQVELYEAPKDFLGLPPGGRLDDDQIRSVIDYMMDGRRRGLE